MGKQMEVVTLLRKLTVLVLLFVSCGIIVPGIAWAEASGLTLNQAISMTVKHSIAVEKAELEIDRAESSCDEAEDRHDTVVEDVYSDYSDWAAAWASVLRADLSWQKAKKSYDATLDGVALKACQLYWGILEAQEKLAGEELAFKQVGLELEKSRIAYEHGLVSKYGPSVSVYGKTVMSLDAAETAMIKAQGRLDAAKNSLDSAYVQFSQLVGLSLTSRPVLADDVVEFSPLEVTSLDAEINRVLNESPSVWLAEQNAELAEDLIYWDAVENEEVEQAELEVDSAEDAVELQVRNLYYTLKELEQSHASAERSVALAEANLKVKQALQQIGQATAVEVLDAEAALAEAKLSLKQTSIQYAYNKLLFEKPWASSYS